MDPLSIAASATALAASCAKVSAVLYTWVDETRNVDTNVSGFCEEVLSLSRILDAIGKSIKENPIINGPGSDQDNELWSNFKVTLDDCQATLDKLNDKLEDVQNATPFGFGILRRPVKQIRLSLKMKEIEVYRQRIQHYNGAMQLPLQMINISVLLQSRAGQESTDSEIAGLREQVGRVEKGLRLRYDPQTTAEDLRDENSRLFQNLMRLVRQADSFQSKASSIAGTIYGGSVLGDPLSRDQWVSIENWIPPLIIEEPRLENLEVDHPPTATTSLSLERSSDALKSLSSYTTDMATEQSGSESDSELERDMTKKFKELALGSFQRQEHDKAEKLLVKVINRLTRIAKNGHPPDPELRMFEVRLAVVHCLQGRWKDAEGILVPMTADKSLDIIEPFHGMHALALRHTSEKNYATAIRHCKRAISGKRRILGKEHFSLGHSISLLALIFEKAGDPTEAEAYRSFLLDSFPDLQSDLEQEPSRYIEENFGLDKGSKSLGDSDSKSRATTFFVGIDLGIVNTSVAIGYIFDGRLTIDRVTRWPGAKDEVTHRVPTVLYYDQYQHAVGWGSDTTNALARNGYPQNGVQKHEWFVLQPTASSNTFMAMSHDLPPLPPGKSAIDIIADFLARLKPVILDHLPASRENTYQPEHAIEYTITTPAAFDDTGKAAIHAAAVQAGYLHVQKRQVGPISISRPQATLLSLGKSSAVGLQFMTQVILVVHCGSGLAELASYHASIGSLLLGEYTRPTGDFCGSTSVNRNFSNILRARIRKMRLPDGSKTAGKVYARCILDFAERIRYIFNNDGRSWNVDVGIEAEFPDAGLEGGYMTFKNADILACLEPPVDRIIELIQEQLVAILAKLDKRRNERFETIFVSGDYSRSEYLFQSIKELFGPLPIEVIRGSGSDITMAAAEGAVLAGAALAGVALNPSISSREC